MIHYDRAGIIVRESEEKDIDQLKDRLKEADRQEVWASDHFTPEQALRASFAMSTERFTFLYKGEVVGMFGVRPESLMSRRAIVWLLTSEKIDLMKKTFLKLCVKFIRLMQVDYPVLYNFVDSRHHASVSWLKWAGAEILPPINFGADKLPFHPFVFGGQ